ncbi:MAG: hypothetical protein BMS9Abin21_207 [Thermodesulfovibrionia bacterium]|nr:MAG: hypothetical protein BMS9Abin21_207 [Thermodesulfovibrionia bacterium]
MQINEILALEKQGKLPPEAVSALNEARDKGLIVGNELVAKKEPVSKPPVSSPPEREPLSLFQKLGGRSTAEDVGGTLGGIAGGLLGLGGGPAGAVGGALLGSGLGGAAANQIVSLLSGDQPNNLSESSLQALQAGTKQAAFELVPPALRAVGSGTAKIAGNLLGVNTPQAKKLAGEAVRTKIPLGALDVTDSSLTRGASKVFGVMPFVGGPIRKSKISIGEAITKKAEKILIELGPNVGLSKLSSNLQESAKATSKEFKEVAGDLYKKFETLASDSKIIDTKDISVAARETIEQFTKDAPILNNGKKLDLLKDNEIIERIAQLSDLPEKISVPEFRAIQKQLNSLLRSEKGLDFNAIANVKSSLESALKTVDTSGLDNADEVISALNSANKFYSEGITKFQTATSKKLGRVDKNIFGSNFFKAGTVEADELINTLKNIKSPTALKNLREVIGEDVFSQFRRGWIEDSMRKSVKQSNVSGEIVNEIDPKSLANSLGFTGAKIDREVIEELFKGSNVSPERMDRFLRLMSKAEAKFVPDPSTFLTRRIILAGPGSVLKLLGLGATAASASGAVVGIGPIKAGVLFLTGRQLSKALSSPKALSVLQAGIANPPQTADAAKALALRLITAMPEEFEEQNMNRPTEQN